MNWVRKKKTKQSAANCEIQKKNTNMAYYGRSSPKKYSNFEKKNKVHEKKIIQVKITTN